MYNYYIYLIVYIILINYVEKYDSYFVYRI